MGGIEAITAKILDDARREAKAAEDAAQKKAKERLEAERQKMRAEQKKYEEKRAREAQLTAERAEAADRQRAAQQRMRVRMEVIEEIIKKSGESILAMSDKDYFAALKKLITSSGAKGECELILNSRDKARMPEDFLSECESAACGLKLSLAEENASISGGFIIRKNRIEENFAIEDIIEFRHDELCDMLNAFLKE
ncbi:MAG: V-type ATP synthase subunit E [Clostridiales bacterium]|nr:V-type ATP synthase subunit E [Clostridiales bacterium]